MHYPGMTNRRRTARRLALVILAAGVLGVLAGSAIAGSGRRAATRDAAAAKVSPYISAAKYIYGKNWKAHLGTTANPKAKPINIGWMNIETGIYGRPWLTRIGKAAVSMINDQLGGVNGHPIKLDYCPMSGIEAEGQACAQQFINNSDVAVAGGSELIGASSYVQTMQGQKPTFLAIPSNANLTAKNGYAFTGASASLSSVMAFLHRQGVNKLVEIWNNLPATVGAATFIGGLAKKAGIQNDNVFYPPNTSDFTSVIASAHLDQHDAAFLFLPDGSLCASIIRAIAASGSTIPIYSDDACINQNIKAAFGDYPKWNYIYYSLNPRAIKLKSNQQPIAAFLSALKASGDSSDINEEFSTLPFGEVVTMAKILAGIAPHPIDARTVSSAAAAFSGFAYLGPKQKFGQAPFTAAGSLAVNIYDYLGNGNWKNATHGWFTP